MVLSLPPGPPRPSWWSQHAIGLPAARLLQVIDDAGSALFAERLVQFLASRRIGVADDEQQSIVPSRPPASPRRKDRLCPARTARPCRYRSSRSSCPLILYGSISPTRPRRASVAAVCSAKRWSVPVRIIDAVRRSLFFNATSPRRPARRSIAGVSTVTGRPLSSESAASFVACEAEEAATPLDLGLRDVRAMIVLLPSVVVTLHSAFAQRRDDALRPWDLWSSRRRRNRAIDGRYRTLTAIGRCVLRLCLLRLCVLRLRVLRSAAMLPAAVPAIMASSSNILGFLETAPYPTPSMRISRVHLLMWPVLAHGYSRPGPKLRGLSRVLHGQSTKPCPAECSFYVGKFTKRVAWMRTPGISGKMQGAEFAGTNLDGRFFPRADTRREQDSSLDLAFGSATRSKRSPRTAAGHGSRRVPRARWCDRVEARRGRADLSSPASLRVGDTARMTWRTCVPTME